MATRMATSSLLSPMPPFDIHDESANVSVRWKLWLERFETFLVASDIKEESYVVVSSWSSSRKNFQDVI